VNEFVTLDRSDPLFESYLLGRPSKEFRAVPIRSLYINSESERVTFQILPREELTISSVFASVAQVMRLDLLTLTLAPAFSIWAAAFAQKSTTAADIVLGALALILLHGAFFARNDFIDHIRGVDRLNEMGGSRVIQKGSLRAATVRNMYWVFFILGALLSIPVLIHQPVILWACIAAGVFGIYGYSQLRWSKTGGILGGLMLFLCTGPFLTWGAQVITLDGNSSTMNGNGLFLRLGALLLGVLFGLISVIYVETRHMISLVVDDEAGVQTLPVKIGFDRAKFVLSALYFIVSISTIATFYIWFSWMGALAALPLALLGLRLCVQMYKVSSPLASRLPVLLKHAIYLHLSLGLVFTLLNFI
jgi:1,4-dihydroxy-2-naphthoate polyprenyltransferase